MHQHFFVPWREPIVDQQQSRPGMIPVIWQRFFEDVNIMLSQSSQSMGRKELTTQGAAIATTALVLPTLTADLYRVSYAARITRAATTSSSLTITLSWVSGGVACSQTFAAMTGNTTATQQSGSALAKVDAGTSISYAAAYASVGATSMQYELSVIVEQMG